MTVHIDKGANRRHVAPSCFADLHQAPSRQYTHDLVGDGRLPMGAACVEKSSCHLNLKQFEKRRGLL